MDKARTVSVVIPCLNCAETIPRLVRALRQQELPNGTKLEIVVVDNGSSDGTLNLLEALPARVIRERKRGPAPARNAGVRASTGDVIVFLDADTRPANGKFIARHLEMLDSDEGIGISGGAISPDPEQKSLVAFAENATALFNWHDRLPRRALSFQPAGNLAFRRDLFDRIGPMNEALLWLEDFEWNHRVVQAGYSIVFDPRPGVYIRGRQSFRKAMRKFYTWGLNIRAAYVPGRSEQVWLFEDHPSLFALNVPLRILNETWVTVKSWFRVCPLRTLILIPLFLLYRAAWAAGMAVGASRYLRSRRASVTSGKDD